MDSLDYGMAEVEFPTANITDSDAMDRILDKNWARRAFLLPDMNLSDKTDVKNRYWSSASLKFTDTRYGGSIGVNAKPQFTRYSDVRVKGRVGSRNDVTLSNVGGNYGMGRYYSEAIDDNEQRIYIRAGVPQFNSILGFFSKAFDGNAATLARTGRNKSIVYNITEAIGAIGYATAFPVIALSVFAARTVNLFFGTANSKFYTLKPTMHLYWSAVTALVNTIAINKGIMPRILESSVADQIIGNPYKLDGVFMDQLHAMMPDMFSKDRYLDVFSMVNKAQRTANRLFAEDHEKLDKASGTDFVGVIKKSYQDKRELAAGELSSDLMTWIKTYANFSYWFANENSKLNLESSPKTDPNTGDVKPVAEKDSFFRMLDAEYNSGSQFAVFNVEHTGPVSESFSNAYGESDLSSKFNSAASTAREMRFNMSGGNIGDGVIFNTIEKGAQLAADAVTGLLSGATDGLANVVINGVLGGSYMDIPKNYKSSQANMPETSYKIVLTSPYGNPISQMRGLYIPLAMLLALVLPLSTGKQSYAGPFLVQLFDRGRSQIQLGAVKSLVISRGNGNLGFTRKGNALSIEVTITIENLSSIMHMPISQGKFLEGDIALDSDNILQDYLAVLAGQGVYDQVYALPKAKMQFAKLLRSTDKLFSPAYWASFVHEEMTTNSLATFLTLGLNKAYDALTPGSDVVSR